MSIDFSVKPEFIKDERMLHISATSPEQCAAPHPVPKEQLPQTQENERSRNRQRRIASSHQLPQNPANELLMVASDVQTPVAAMRIHIRHREYQRSSLRFSHSRRGLQRRLELAAPSPNAGLEGKSHLALACRRA
mmetsp:Transcript_14317/g.35748  ORF Transcript_14317/g.35748 Transcript_14317/m.35748 type:complete len:135 (+) Transcript_14317:50-454(+)